MQRPTRLSSKLTVENVIYFLSFTLMKELLLIFGTYYFDFEERNVHRLLKGDKTRVLKWAHPNPKYPNTERVTLYRDKKPIYVFRKDFKIWSNGECLALKDEVLKISPKEEILTSKKEPVKPEEVDPIAQEQEMIINYFFDKENALTRKDWLIKKFGKEVFERNLDLLIETKMPDKPGTYYKLIKRFYA